MEGEIPFLGLRSNTTPLKNRLSQKYIYALGFLYIVLPASTKYLSKNKYKNHEWSFCPPRVESCSMNTHG